eukprot:gene51317-62754_t
MALDPEILFLDEPSAGLDPITSAGLDALILSLARETGTTFVVVTHELQSILAIGDRCIMLDKDAQGMIAEGDPKQLRDESEHPTMASARKIQLSVGVMVVVGLALLVGFVLFLTQNRTSTSDILFETYIRESVQGLEVGSPVRYRGVAVGRVTEIALAAAEYRRPEGEGFAAAFQLVVVRFAVNLRRVGDVPSTEEAVRQGLRARMASQGITGVGYIELDFLDPERFPLASVPWTPRYSWIPAVPSTVAQVTSAAEMFLRQIQAIDFGGLVGHIN